MFLLTQIGSERNVYEEEIAAYDKENKALKEKVTLILWVTGIVLKH